MHTLTPLDHLRGVTLTLGIAFSGLACAQLGTTYVTPSSSAGVTLHQASSGSSVSWLESTDTNQIRIRQYVAPTGQIYAVSWDGPAMPDIRALFGDWFGRYQQGAIEAQSSAGGLHSSSVEGSDLVVESSVRLREFTGRAWLPAALPAGVTSTDIE
jgi:Protein of unknown function (DUF2844)